MKENRFNYLIKTNEKEEVVVSCKELYLELGLTKQNWSTWYKTNITDNKYLIEDTDYQTLFIIKNGNETLDFALTLDTAKKISMTVMTDKGNDVRDYFLQVERERNQLIQNQLQTPQDYPSALRALADEDEIRNLK